MRRTAVLAVFLSFAIILAGCGGHTVDEELLPTRVPTLDPQALAQAAVESMPTPRPSATDTPIPPTPTPEPEPTATSTPVLPTPVLEPTAEPELSATESSTESNTASNTASGADPVTATANITDTIDASAIDASAEVVEPTDEGETADVTGDKTDDQTSAEPESEQVPVAASEAVTDTTDVVDTVPDVEGGLSPNTAQHALRQARVAARNVAAHFGAGEPARYTYRNRGLAVTLGKWQGTAKVRRFTFTGPLAWWMGRSYHLAMIPGLARKARIVSDWTMSLLFPRDVSQLGQLGKPTPLE